MLIGNNNMKIVKLAAFGYGAISHTDAVKKVLTPIVKQKPLTKIIPLADKLKFAMKDIGKI